MNETNLNFNQRPVSAPHTPMPITTVTKNGFTNNNTVIKRDNFQPQILYNNINGSLSTLHSFPSSTIYDNRNCLGNQNILVIPTNGFNQQKQQESISKNNKQFDNQEFSSLTLNKSNYLNNNNNDGNQKFVNNLQHQHLQQRRYLKKENLTEFPVNCANQKDELLRLNHTMPLTNSNVTYSNSSSISSNTKLNTNSKIVLNPMSLSQKHKADCVSMTNQQIAPQILTSNKNFNKEIDNSNSHKFISNESLLNNNNNNINLINNVILPNYTNNDNSNSNSPTFNNQFNGGTVAVQIPAELIQSTNLSIAVSLYFF